MPPSVDPARTDVLAGRFELRSVLGRGGMSTVWSARDLRLDRDVAVKILRSDVSAEHAGRIEREARAAAKIRDRRVVTVLDLDRTDEGQPFLVFEALDGRTLADELLDGALERRRAARLADDLLGALVAAHEAGVLHRDIKPANVLLDRDGFRVTDFGIASIDDETATDTALVGTLRYIAPERFDGEPATARGDVFSAAAVLYEAYAGAHPFAAEDPGGVLGRMRTGRFGDDSDDLPDHVRDALADALDPVTDRRPTAAQLRDRLRRDPALDRTAVVAPADADPTQPLDQTMRLDRVEPLAGVPATDSAPVADQAPVPAAPHADVEAADHDFLEEAADQLDRLADVRTHPRMQGLRDRLRWSEKSVLIIGSLLLVILLLIVAGTDGIGGDSGGDPSVDSGAEDPAVQLDRQLGRIEDLG